MNEENKMEELTESAETSAPVSEEIPAASEAPAEVPADEVPDAELEMLAENVTSASMKEYISQIDRQYDERKARRAERLAERKKKEKRNRRILAALLILLLAAGGTGGWLLSQGRITPDLRNLTAKATEASTEAVTEAPTEAPTEIPTEAVTEAPTEAVTEAMTEAPTEAVGISAGENTEGTGEEQGQEEAGNSDTSTDPDAPVEGEDTSAEEEHDPTFDEIVAERPDFFSGYSINASEGETITDENVLSTYAIVVNATSGEVLAQRDADVVVSPASMTKILTVLVAAEHLEQSDLDKTVTIDMDVTDYSYVNGCSVAGFERDEVVTVRDLFYGTILPSGGDAAYALARYVAGSQEKFVQMMNKKLDDLGLSDTAHFTNAVGLYDEDHHCTMADMAMILKAAVNDNWCRQVLSAHTYTTSKTEQHPDGIVLSNWFLRRIEDRDSKGLVLCAKTGFVNEAGCCAASYIIGDNGVGYICVTANALSTWDSISDHVLLYNTYIDLN